MKQRKLDLVRQDTLHAWIRRKGCMTKQRYVLSWGQECVEYFREMQLTFQGGTLHITKGKFMKEMTALGLSRR